MASCIQILWFSHGSINHVQAEQSDLVEAISESKRNIKLRIDAATVDSLRDIVTHGVKILHYSGHGFENALALEDGRGGLHVNFSTDKLVPLFSAGQTRGIDIVFVAACNSEFVGKAFSSAGVPFVVAVKCASGGADTKTSGLISDKAARVFLRSFYLALLVGRSVLESFEIGRARVHSDPTPEIASDAQKFLMFNPSGQDSILFPAETTSRGLWDMINPSLPSQIPRVPKGFVGRQADIHRLFNRLLSRRFVWLQGDKGIGKTATILAAAHYMHQRRACVPVYLDASKKLSTMVSPGQAAVPLESRDSILSQLCFQIGIVLSHSIPSLTPSPFYYCCLQIKFAAAHLNQMLDQIFNRRSPLQITPKHSNRSARPSISLCRTVKSQSFSFLITLNFSGKIMNFNYLFQSFCLQCRCYILQWHQGSLPLRWLLPPSRTLNLPYTHHPFLV
jgi:hypothetical protein